MGIILVSDHAGFALKEELKAFLISLGHDIEDAGVFTSSAPADDYPIIAAQAAERVVRKEFEKGIFICGTGIGMTIVANKVPGIRAALCNDLYSAKKSREHNDANVCGLGARIVGSDLAKEIVKLWIDTNFAGGRHALRNEKLIEIEKKFFKGM